MKQKSGIVNPFNKQGTISRQSREISNFSAKNLSSQRKFSILRRHKPEIFVGGTLSETP